MLSSGTSKYPFLQRLGLQDDNLGCFDGKKWCGSGVEHTAMNPTTNEAIAKVRMASVDEYNRAIDNMEAARKAWAAFPAPKRGDIVRQIGNALRQNIVNKEGGFFVYFPLSFFPKRNEFSPEFHLVEISFFPHNTWKKGSTCIY